ncbi:uncharacterized protein [Venturia canescens]|uniref:uncharacterized protein n=2 Tax=Venturia canescens TaxID=32260 RepID=UPI001C9D4A30|nr:uncharacterized protein LOC122413456 [Venturia canescens]
MASIKSVAAKAAKLKSLKASCSAPSFTSSKTSDSVTAQNEFNFRELCLICGMPWDRNHQQSHMVQNNYIKEKLLDIAKLRGDSIAIEVMNRLNDVVSLVAVGARYHHKCQKMFSKILCDNSASAEREAEVQSAFRQVTEYIEKSQKGKFTAAELDRVMRGKTTYDRMFQMLMDHYGGDIYILKKRGTDTLIFYRCFSTTKLCGDWYTDPNSLKKKQKEALVNAAAQIIRKDIESHVYEHDVYPPAGRFLSSVQQDIPPLLRTFIDTLIVPDLLNLTEDHDERYFVQRSAIAHSILSLVRRSGFTSHLQLALGIYIHRKCGSKLIIDLLHKLGACVSYYQLQQYEASVIMDPPKFVFEENICVQHVFDNTDHNVGTLDGYNTYHCLGGIAIYSPEENVSYEGRTKKLKNASNVSSATIASQSIIRTIPWTAHCNGLDNIVYTDTAKLFSTNSSVLPAAYSTYLWAKHCDIENVPSWRGFMEVLTADSTYNVSKVVCLPFINHPPSNMSTINTALRTALADARRVNQKTCFVTFDQPLYHKAREIVAASEGELDDVVVRLGGFHLLMSYLGSIGHIMDGSGLEDVWAVAYAPASVKKMLTGHAYARAIRAHILTFTALGMMICRETEDEVRTQYERDVKSFLQRWSTEPPTIGDCQVETSIAMMTSELIAQLTILKNRGPTSQLWVQYFECIVIALQFIEAERSGNWNLHLQSVRNMLPIFHAAGHFNYAKSAQIYLQDMVNLEVTMTDEEYRRFTTDGNFTVRRSDKAWCGVWTDMTIEQTLNRFFGIELKHGRGVTPSVVARFLSIMPSSFSIIKCLEDYCGIESITSAQHVDLANYRIQRDNEDIKKFIFWFEEHGPFKHRTSLFFLSTGLVGATTTDCHLAFEKGKHGMAWMVGKTVAKISLSSSNKVKNLAAVKVGTHVSNETFSSVDSTLLFQRISVLFHGNEAQTRKAFEFELSPYPLSLFDELGLMRKTAKSELYKILKPYVLQTENILRNVTFVIDGGFLLHSMSWPHGASFGVICEVYHSHIISKYGENSWVVFDGYSNDHIGIKSYERYRRRQRNMAPDVDFTESTLVTLSQTRFLSNTLNKMKLIQLLSQYLSARGINVKVAQEDADALIARAAIEQRQKTGREVAVVGNDTDLLVLLIVLTHCSRIFFYKITPNSKKDTLYATDDHADLKPFILFAHAFSGCDTTSAIYGKGKKSLFSILKKNSDLQNIVQTFYNAESTIESLCKFAEQIIAHLYSFKNSDQSLSDARYQKFTTLAVHASVEIRLAQLPPTQPVLREHVKRTFYQIQSWLSNELNPEDWGWRRTRTMMVPVMNPENSAPDNLLTLVSCSCTGDCKTARCTCRKSGLPCTQLCKHCEGQSCSNVAVNSIRNEMGNIAGEQNEDDERLPVSEFLNIAAELHPDDPDNYDEINGSEGEEEEEDMEIEYNFYNM